MKLLLWHSLVRLHANVPTFLRISKYFCENCVHEVFRNEKPRMTGSDLKTEFNEVKVQNIAAATLKTCKKYKF